MATDGAMIRRLLLGLAAAMAMAGGAAGQLAPAPGVGAGSIVTLEVGPSESSEPEAAVPADPYAWSASRSAEGRVILSGYLPPEMQQLLSERFGAEAVAATVAAEGAPDGFADDALAALAALELLEEGEVRFDGAAWSLAGTGEVEEVRAALAAAATPAEAWDIAIFVPAGEPAAEAVDPAYAFSAVRFASGATALWGQVPSEAAAEHLAGLLGARPDALRAAPGAPADFLEAAEAGVLALAALEEGRLDFAGGAWTLTGEAAAEPEPASEPAVEPEPAAEPAVEPEAPAEPEQASEPQQLIEPQEAVEPQQAIEPQQQVEPMQAIEPAQPVEPAPEAAPSTVEDAVPAGEADGVALCRGHLAAFSARNAILFQSGSAAITPESRPALAELAGYLAECPEAPIYVEGHTDSDGDAGANLVLSVARAEAVVAALVELGVSPRRLYAVGYGESAPIASNDTAEGKRLNRRIVVGLEPLAAE